LLGTDHEQFALGKLVEACVDGGRECVKIAHIVCYLVG
jgi:hypothetical protein